jgi:ribosomal protein L30E
MAYHITVLEPGKKKVVLMAAQGRTTSLLIHASQFPEARKAEIEEYVKELTKANPGYTFALRKIPPGQNIVDPKGER